MTECHIVETFPLLSLVEEFPSAFFFYTHAQGNNPSKIVHEREKTSSGGSVSRIGMPLLKMGRAAGNAHCKDGAYLFYVKCQHDKTIKYVLPVFH